MSRINSTCASLSVRMILATVPPSYPMVQNSWPHAVLIIHKRGIHECGDRRAARLTGRGRDRGVSGSAGSAAAIFLDAGGAQTGQAVLIDGPLPAQELIDRERVTLAGFLEADQTAADGGDHLCLAANDPPFGIPWRQIGDGKRTAVWADHISDARPKMISHGLTTPKAQSEPIRTLRANPREETNPAAFKICLSPEVKEAPGKPLKIIDFAIYRETNTGP